MKYFKFDFKNFQPIFVDWAITTHCYLACTHCRYQGLRSFYNDLPTDKAIELATEIDVYNPHWVLIEGGEPFLRQDIFKIIELLKSNDRAIYIISSGNGFQKEYASRCQELGVKLLISLDSAQKLNYEKIRQGAKFEKVLQAIEISQTYQILDSINFTLQEMNARPEEIKAIGKLAKELKINSINFLGFKPNIVQRTSWVIPNLSEIFSEIVNLKEKLNIKVTVDEPFSIPWLKKFRVSISEPRHKKDGPIVAEAKTGCIFGEYVFIEPNGTLKPCSFSAVSWQEFDGDLLTKIQNKKNRKGKCGRCEYQLECGGCRTRTYALTQDWFESDPYCPL